MRMDKVTTVTYINKLGGSRSKKLSQVAKELWEFCQTHKMQVTAQYLPGKDNIVADWNSRYLRDVGEWTSREDLF